MKLLKIKIHNIASIADAVIDFSEKPLKDEPLFLITGPTGAGKTTILDAICLALYARTPRMERVEGREKYEADESNLQTNDNRQLMRRNTTECYAELVFTGNDEVNYRARWAVRRSYGKVDGKLQAQAHILQNLQTGETFEKSTRTEIERVIGFKYEQFCRTSMLAQGEFTKFLQSNSNDKSDILEKITGTGIYSALGRKLFEITQEKKETLKVWQMKVDGIHTLSVEERLETENSIAAKSGRIKSLEAERTELRKRSEWLARRELLQKQREDIRKKLSDFLNEEAEDGYKDEEALLADYALSSEARVWWTELSSLKADMEKEKKRQTAFKTELSGLLYGLETMQKRKNDCQKRLSELQQSAREQEPHKSMFDGYPKIELWFSQIRSFEKDIQDCRKKMTALAESKKKLDEERKKAVGNVGAKEDELQKMQREIDRCGGVLRQLDFEGLQKKNCELAEMKSRLDAFAMVLTLWKEAQRVCEQERTEIGREDKRIKEQERELPLKRQEYSDKKKENEKWEETYDRMSQSLKDWAREARHRLQVGDACPVCGWVVEQPLHDDTFVSALAPVERSRNESREQLKRLGEVLMAAEKEYEETKKQHVRHTEQLDRQEKECTKRKEAVETACRECGVSLDENEGMEDVLNRLRNANREGLENVAAGLERVAAANRELTSLQGGKDRLIKDLEKLKTERTKTENALLTLDNEYANLRSHQSRDEEEIGSRRHQIDALITREDRRALWNSDGERFVAELKRETDAYRQGCEEEQTVRHEISGMTLVLENISRFREKILAAIPAWAAMKAEGGVAAEGDLSAGWHALSTDIIQWKQRILSFRESMEEKEQKLAVFFQTHENVDASRLQLLAGCSKERIDTVTERHKQVRDSIVMLRGELKQVEEQERKTLTERPNLSDSDTLEELERRMADNSGQTELLQQSVGAMQQQLKTDAENRKKHEEAIRQKNEFEKECVGWDKLCRLLGDREGKNFRNIAQSFILGHLLRTANQYLCTFTDRYRLTYNPGSLVILVEDKYRQSAPQSASILSGGESFMVSLSLALALSRLDSRQADVDTLFIDEGFGTLDSESLGAVMDTLERLHRMGGRRVGIISHVEELEERIGTKIVVNRSGSSPARVTVESRDFR